MKTDKESNEYTIQIFCRTTTWTGVFNLGLGDPKKAAKGYRFYVINLFVYLLYTFFSVKNANQSKNKSYLTSCFLKTGLKL